MLTFIFALSVVAFVTFVTATVLVMRARSRVRSRVILRHLELIVRQNLPLPSALDLAADTEQGATRRILRRMGRMVRLGLPLSNAVRVAYPGCPSLVLSVLVTSEQSGTLPSALVELCRRPTQTELDDRLDTRSRWAFLIATIVIFVVVYWCYSWIVFPKIRMVLADFTTPAPPLALDILAAHPLSGMSLTTTGGKAMRLMLLALFFAGPAALLWILLALRPRRADRLGPIDWFGDFIWWFTWPLGRIAEAGASASVMPTLRLAMGAGWSLPDAIAQAATLDTNYYFRVQLVEWCQRVREGEDATAAARASGLPDMFVRCVAMGMRDGDMDAPLAFGADYFAALTLRRRTAAVHLFWPVATLIVAAMVGAFVWATVVLCKTLIDVTCAQIG
jgi:type II secretory pathway component PulF